MLTRTIIEALAGARMRLALLALLALALAAGLGLAQRPAPALPPEAELGRQLFYDRRLSADGSLACAGCHVQALGFADGRAVPAGVGGEPLRRNSLGLFNVGELAALTWADPSLTSLEAQAERPLLAEHPREMGAAGREEEILGRLRADPAAASRFAAAFPHDPDPLRWARVVEALAAFERALVARGSPYDRFAAGDSAALSPAAQRGMRLFFSTGLACGHCHTDIAPPGQAPRWADLAYVATGAGLSDDRGLAEATGRAEDAYRFRVPPLRNAAVTAPYMHDGSLATLDDVLGFYASGGLEGGGSEPERRAARHPLVAGFALGQAERADLLAFLGALTDEAALRDPRFADPAAP